MLAENPLALSYILPADVFFLPGDRLATAELAPEMPETAPTVQAEEPIVNYTEPVPAPVAKVAEIATPAAEPTIPQIPVIPKAAPPTPTETPVLAFNYLGGYQQKFLTIVNYPNHDVMDPAHLNALESTIKRKEMSLDDVAIFNIGKYPGTDIKSIGRFFKPKRMLLLGKDSFPAGLATPVFNELTMLGTCQLLYSHSFGEMMGNKDLVKAFWEQMKLL